jgi:hypothetical protein
MVAQDVDPLATLNLERLLRGIAMGRTKGSGSLGGLVEHAQLGAAGHRYKSSAG